MPTTASHVHQDFARPKVKFATRIAMAHRDLLEAADFLDALTNLPTDWPHRSQEEAARRGLLSAAIVYYAKSFTTNRGIHLADPRLVPLFQVEDVATFHQNLMALRHKVVAHSDATAVPAQILDHNQPGMLVVATPKKHPLDGLDIKHFGCHIDAILSDLRTMLHQLSEELQKVPGALGPKVHLEIMDNEDRAEGATGE